jgi:hypothetical protein
MRRAVLLFSVLCLLSSASGCAPVLLATVGAVAGYAISKDSVTLDLDRPWNQVWQACLAEIQEEGRLKKTDQANGRLDARVKETDVVLTLEQLTPSTVRVVIRARQTLLPKVEVAQRIGLGVARRVK